MKIALIQQRASQNPQENLKRGIEAYHRAAAAGAKVIAFAELAFLPFLPQNPVHPEALAMAEPIPGPTTDAFSALAKKYGVVTVLNLFEKDGRETFDSSPVIDADGKILGTTRMVHIMDGLGFFEKGYYRPGRNQNFVFQTAAGRIGVAICYDRHFPEYMRNLGLQQAEIVFVPQAGALAEWPTGIFEAELQVAAFQNGYFAALVNRVGREEKLHFAGESFVVDPFGRVITRAPKERDFILYAECDLEQIALSPAKRFFLRDRRPDFYRNFKILDSKEK